LRFALSLSRSRANHHTVGSHRLPLEAMQCNVDTARSGVRTEFAYSKFMTKIDPVLRQLIGVKPKYFLASSINNWDARTTDFFILV
jgi:hypothetical protein